MDTIEKNFLEKTIDFLKPLLEKYLKIIVFAFYLFFMLLLVFDIFQIKVFDQYLIAYRDFMNWIFGGVLITSFIYLSVGYQKLIKWIKHGDSIKRKLKELNEAQINILRNTLRSKTFVTYYKYSNTGHEANDAQYLEDQGFFKKIDQQKQGSAIRRVYVIEQDYRSQIKKSVYDFYNNKEK